MKVAESLRYGRDINQGQQKQALKQNKRKRSIEVSVKSIIVKNSRVFDPQTSGGIQTCLSPQQCEVERR
ncbi:hypothetical protein E2C01_070284 [Portunus trituberculatus]|uniref:Uncharacterized protein n=1 Tax=Portunus trituberculatus TaxID=210409 RepID=A0A5B7I342_PORTR|nr:hypothetical protein [Portunus trituberculatus]